MPAVPFVWDGGQWVTVDGQWRDLPLIRRGMGEWLLAAASASDVDPAEEERRRDLRARELDARFAANQAPTPEAQEELHQIADGFARELAFMPDRISLDFVICSRMRDVASEMLSGSVGRANQLLSLASQFDAFRAAMKDPADWVARLSAAPRTEHVRTSAVWEAFSLAEPVLARSLGTKTGKSVLFAAMDKRFGARRKLSGYEGWRGVALTASERPPAAV
ncbi:hypothetical protein ACWC9T_34930 [Kitasatospora sp. NPDC001159]